MRKNTVKKNSVLGNHTLQNYSCLFGFLCKQTFLRDILWNLAIFLDRFTLIYILTELRNSLFKNQNKSKMKLEKAVTQTCSVKKVFLKIYQNVQQKHMCLSLFFNEVTGSNFIKKRRRYRYFPLNVA